MSELSVKVVSGSIFPVMANIKLLYENHEWVSNTFCSAVLTNWIAVLDAANVSLRKHIKASHFLPSSLLIRLIFTSITTASHTGKKKSTAVLICVKKHACMSFLWETRLHTNICVQAEKALNICVSFMHLSNLSISQAKFSACSSPVCHRQKAYLVVIVWNFVSSS